MDDLKLLFTDLFFLFFFVFLNAFFVAAEFAIVKVRRTQLELLSANNKKATTSLKLISHLDEYLSATQLGITVASLGLGWIGKPVTSRILEPIFAMLDITNPQTIDSISITVGFIIITFLHIVLGELGPKSLAIRHPRSTTLFIAMPLNFFYKVLKPAIWALNGTANLILRMFGIKPISESERSHSEEELRLLISEGQKTGAIDSTEHQLIERIFEFNDKTADDIMIPRNEVTAVEVDDSKEKIIQVVLEQGYSRIPVYKDDMDNIVGIIYSKDLLTASEHKEMITIMDILRPAHFIPETKHIGEILKEFQKKRIHLAIVVNEHGEMVGLVTLEDIIEEIVGEIEDEYDVEAEKVTIDKKGIFLVNPDIEIDVFNQRFNTDIPDDTEEYNTLSGFLQTVTGHVPEVFERIDYKGLIFTVMKKTGNKLLQVKIQRV
ncbi:MAG: HlyC/CorC family transporter [Ignavibacteriae bacterium]|nr:HlyC/CorC family transporter [Ignavibacteriota bacterium]MCB0723367.1 HlyC/CorC family transporter [Ignavibacteriota bacterium]MCB9243213.1 HlyC/CorC family transporter [Ignavibacteriales bacterium]